jgi:hypothetical protein
MTSKFRENLSDSVKMIRKNILYMGSHTGRDAIVTTERNSMDQSPP